MSTPTQPGEPSAREPLTVQKIIDLWYPGQALQAENFRADLEQLVVAERARGEDSMREKAAHEAETYMMKIINDDHAYDEIAAAIRALPGASE